MACDIDKSEVADAKKFRTNIPFVELYILKS